MKKYIDEELNPAKIDHEKGNYKPPMIIDEIHLKLDTSKENSYDALFISVDDDSELHLIRLPIHVLSITILTQV